MKFKGETYTWMLKTLWERKEREKWLERERVMLWDFEEEERLEKF
jgi:hypothetical protein